MKQYSLPVLITVLAACLLSSCMDSVKVKSATETAPSNAFGGYATKEQWGEHLVTIAACHDCHSPKLMTPQGPVVDSSKLLSGHPSQAPDPDINRKEMESKGLTVTQNLTAWAGPWGLSYAANLTSDSTGIGAWKESQFIYAIREGKLKGLPQSRPILPPMPWDVYRHMTDDELKAIFVYLKSTKPVKNVVPAPKPPVTAQQR